MSADTLVAHSGLACNTINNATTTAKDESITRPPPVLTRSQSLPATSTEAADTHAHAHAHALPELARSSSLPSSIERSDTPIDSDSASVWTIAWSNEMPGPATSKRCGTRWIARLLPPIMLALAGYATYDVVVYCCGMYCSFPQSLAKAY